MFIRMNKLQKRLIYHTNPANVKRSINIYQVSMYYNLYYNEWCI